jgi:hypothetical protein
MSVPTFPDATAQEKFMLMLLERVDALTEELHAVKKELADSRAQQVAPLPSVIINNGRTHSSRWFMHLYTLRLTPLANDVFARRVLKILPDGCVYLLSKRLSDHVGCDVMMAYVEAGAYVNLSVIVNAIHEAIYADHVSVADFIKTNIKVTSLDRNADARCVLHDFIRHQTGNTGLEHGTCFRISDAATGEVRETAVSQIDISFADRHYQIEQPIQQFNT